MREVEGVGETSAFAGYCGIELPETHVAHRDNFCVDLSFSALKSVNARPEPGDCRWSKSPAAGQRPGPSLTRLFRILLARMQNPQNFYILQTYHVDSEIVGVHHYFPTARHAFAGGVKVWMFGQMNDTFAYFCPQPLSCNQIATANKINDGGQVFVCCFRPNNRKRQLLS